VKSCDCRQLSSVLIDHGFFSTVPNQPCLVISINFLELYHALFEYTGDAITAISAALSKLYTQRGFHVNNKKVCSVYVLSFGALNKHRVSQ
jgi:hypothetical protein